MLRRRKDEVLDLPPKTRTWLDVEVPEGTAQTETAEVLATLMAGQANQGAGLAGAEPPIIGESLFSGGGIIQIAGKQGTAPDLGLPFDVHPHLMAAPDAHEFGPSPERVL